VACFGPMVVSVWRLVKRVFVCVVASLLCLAYAWCHFERLPIDLFTPHRVMVGSCISFFDGITHILLNCIRSGFR